MQRGLKQIKEGIYQTGGSLFPKKQIIKKDLFMYTIYVKKNQFIIFYLKCLFHIYSLRLFYYENLHSYKGSLIIHPVNQSDFTPVSQLFNRSFLRT